MKTMINVALILCLLAISCRRHKDEVIPATDITVICDLTDTLRQYPVADPILAIYGFTDMPDQAAHLRVVLLTDKKLNPIENVGLESGDISEEHNTNDDLQYREQIIYSFEDAARKALAEFPKQHHSKPLEHSECFATISSELSHLAESKSSQRILIVFSDLQENEDDFSCYTDEGQSLLEEHPEKVEKVLQKRCPLPQSLKGVTVYVVYEPADRDEDSRFEHMAGLYRQLLKERGARVVIQASNKTFKP